MRLRTRFKFFRTSMRIGFRQIRRAFWLLFVGPSRLQEELAAHAILHPPVEPGHPSLLCKCDGETVHRPGCEWAQRWCSACTGEGICHRCQGDGVDPEPRLRAAVAVPAGSLVAMSGGSIVPAGFVASAIGNPDGTSAAWVRIGDLTYGDIPAETFDGDHACMCGHPVRLHHDGGGGCLDPSCGCPYWLPKKEE